MQVTERAYQSSITELENVIFDMHVFLRRHNIHKPSTISEKNRSKFLAWPEARLARVTKATRKILDVHLEVEKSGFDLDDSTHLLRVALRVLGLVIDPTFYTMIDRNDIVEVYDQEHFQLFRSFNFFRVCNYSLDDILASEWYELYDRDEKYTMALLNAAQSHLNGTTNISDGATPEHILKEKFSQTRTAFVVKNKKNATVFSGPERKPGYVCIGTVRMMSQC